MDPEVDVTMVLSILEREGLRKPTLFELGFLCRRLIEREMELRGEVAHV